MRIRGLAPLRNRDFALYWAGTGMSQVGDSMETTATAWLLYDLTHSPVLLGLGGAIRAATVIAFGLFGGAIADRVDRRKLLLFTQSAFAGSSLILGLLVISGAVEVWHIYAFIAVNGMLGSFDAPARRSLFPALVPRGELQNAVTLNSTLNRTAKLASAPIAGLVIATAGPGVAYLVNVVSYAGIIAALVVMRPPERAPRQVLPLLREVAAGPTYALTHPILRSLILFELLHGLFGLNTAFLTILASDVFHTGAAGLGLLLGAQAFGSVTSAFVLVAIGDVRRKADAMFASGAAYAVSFALLGALAHPIAGLALVGMLGLTDGFWTTLRNTIFQLRADDRFRGRALSVLLLATRGGGQASQLETGLAVSAGGPAFASLLGGAVIVASVLTLRVRDFDALATQTAAPVLPAAGVMGEDEAVG